MNIFLYQEKIAIITDTGVPEKWVNIVKEQCPDSFICTILQGEPSKCFDQYKKSFRRNDFTQHV